jgi:hypothetical protein
VVLRKPDGLWPGNLMVIQNMEMESNIKKQNQIFSHRKNARLTLLIGIPILIISPFIITGFSYFKWANFTNTGQIGDTIGGITGPIINLISAILIYLSFRQQLLANEIQIELINSERSKDISRSERELLILHYNEIKDSINSLKYQAVHIQSGNFQNTFHGTEALETFMKEISGISNYDSHEFWISINVILIEVEAYIDFLKRSESIDPADKQFFGFRIHTLFFNKVILPLSQIDTLNSQFKKGVSIREFINKLAKELDEFDRPNDSKS